MTEGLKRVPTPCIGLGGIKIRESALLLPGHAVWLLQGKPVWLGTLGQPVEDLDFDEMVLHPDDIAEVKRQANVGSSP